MFRLPEGKCKHASGLSLVAASLCLITGCIDRSTSGNSVIYTFSLWILGAIVLGGLALIGICLTVKKKGWKTYVLMAVGLLVIVVGVPMMRSDRLEVDEQGFKSRHGLPWNPVEHNIRFDSLQEIRIQVTEKRVEQLGTTTESYALFCLSKSGSSEEVPVGDLMKAALRQILDNARKKGVRLLGTEQLPEDMRPKERHAPK